MGDSLRSLDAVLLLFYFIPHIYSSILTIIIFIIKPYHSLTHSFSHFHSLATFKTLYLPFFVTNALFIVSLFLDNGMDFEGANKLYTQESSNNEFNNWRRMTICGGCISFTNRIMIPDSIYRFLVIDKQTIKQKH